MTATRVLQRNEEDAWTSPWTMQSELLQPLIERTFSILLRAGVFQQAPDIFKGQDVDIEYVSPLAKAQKSRDLNAVMRVLKYSVRCLGCSCTRLS